MIAKTFTAPLERVKMMSQTGEGGRGVINIYRNVVRTEGIRGLWAGNGANLLRIFPSKGIVFSSNDVYKTALCKLCNIEVKREGENVKAPGNISFCAGGMAGMTASALTYPLDFVRGRISGKGVLPNSSKKYTGILQTINLTIKEEGPTALYKGVRPTLLGAVPYEGIKFGTVGFLETLFPNDTSDSNIIRKVIFGAAGGVSAGCITYPNDTIRRLLQLQGTPGAENFNGYFDCARKTYNKHGLKRFYAGMGVNLIRMAPNTAVQFGAYEMLKELSAKY
ncbi:hypothetical protein TrVE_jg6677 [Triparma verrucosa]|uniref:Uncharacterized protein n=1 Tax=Triparma verrucosa TaxID=1606542 RepID=A0A9W7B6K3_9STRA|nr:hypothetical protein TrVE_jg6677 [Triparma verrucosa]